MLIKRRKEPYLFPYRYDIIRYERSASKFGKKKDLKAFLLQEFS